MNATRRDRAADIAQADRLIGIFYESVVQINDSEPCADPDIDVAMAHIRDDLRFAADLLFAYRSAIDLGTPGAEMSTYIVDRFLIGEGHPPTGENVLVWTDDEADQPWLGWYDGSAWWYVDAAPILHVRAWAFRPGRSA